MAIKNAGAALGAGAQPERVAPGAKAAVKAAAGKQKAARETTRGRDKPSQAGDERGRDTRAQETRSELFDRVDEDQPYIRPTSLEAPEPLPGFKQRWIRVGMGQNLDTKNLTRKLREGWRARASGTVPRGFHVPRITSGQFAGTIMVEGMLLCMMPKKLAGKRVASISAETKAKTDAVNENLMRVNQVSGGGFGPIRKGERSKMVREQAIAKAAEEAEDVDLTS